jgi:hypothetical protein
MAIRPCPQIGLAAIHVDDVEQIDADDLHHVVHEYLVMKAGEILPWALHGVPSPTGRAASRITLANGREGSLP